MSLSDTKNVYLRRVLICLTLVPAVFCTLFLGIVTGVLIHFKSLFRAVRNAW